MTLLADALVTLGALLLVGGVTAIYPPAGAIVAGAILITFAFQLDREADGR